MPGGADDLREASCREPRKVWLCDGAMRPLARARSTRVWACSTSVRSAAATSSGPSSGLSDDTSSVSRTASSTRRNRSIRATRAARAAASAGASPSGAASAATAGRPGTAAPPSSSSPPDQLDGRCGTERSRRSSGSPRRASRRPSVTTGLWRASAVDSARKGRVMGERLGGDDHRGRGVADQLGQFVEVRSRRGDGRRRSRPRRRRVAGPRWPGDHRDAGVPQRRADVAPAPRSCPCRCRRTPAP